MMIDDLNDEMLREILCRLPCYRTALRCKAVSKRWYSLISDPLFVTQGFLTHREVEKEPSLVFLLPMKMWDETSIEAMVAPPCFQKTVWSRILSLHFLPFHSKLVATFKDLILTFGVNPLTSLGEFYISNPLTKQWMVLPPSHVHQKKVIWATLTYLDAHSFRVVAAHSFPKGSTEDPFRTIKLLVYISETREWRNIDVTLKLSNGRYIGLGGRSFNGVACKGMVCMWIGRHFGALNPFDVTDTFHWTLMARNLPLPASSILLTESDGKLIAYQDTRIILQFKADSYGNLDDKLLFAPQAWRIWKSDLRLENDKQVVQWELISKLDGYINVKGYILTSLDEFSSRRCHFRFVGVHPTDECLIYLIKTHDLNHQLILLDTKSKSLEPLTRIIPPHEIGTCNYKLDIPSWPTPIPIR